MTYLLILDVSEGDEWPVNSALGPFDPSPRELMDPQNASSKNSERNATWTAICFIKIGGLI